MRVALIQGWALIILPTFSATKNWQEANQLAAYKHGRGRGLNPGSLGHAASQASTFLENQKQATTCLFHFNKSKQSAKITRISHEQSSLTVVSKSNLGTQLTLLLLHSGLVQKCYLLGGGRGARLLSSWASVWALIKLFCLHVRFVFEVGDYSQVGDKYGVLTIIYFLTE